MLLSTSNFKIIKEQAWWISPSRLFDGRQFFDNKTVQILNDKIVAVDDKINLAKDVLVLHTDQTICPGFFDIQVNGGGGVMFNNDPSVNSLEIIHKAHLNFGTTSWLPTFITDTAEMMQKAVCAVIEANGRFGIAGIHLEGPFINIAHKGTHKPSYIRKIDELFFDLIVELQQHKIPTLITLAPECVPVGTIERLTRLNALVSAGHTKASYEQTMQAIDEGLTCFTHLFNGMPQMTSRAPGVVAAALGSRAYCGLIADGHHVSYPMVDLAIRARKLSHHMIVVSDAMATVGGPNHFILYGERINVHEGKLVNEVGSLAGAHIDMMKSVKNLINHTEIGIESALSMATKNPASFLGLDDHIGSIKQGSSANILFLNKDFNITNVLFNGEFTQLEHDK